MKKFSAFNSAMLFLDEAIQRSCGFDYVINRGGCGFLSLELAKLFPEFFYKTIIIQRGGNKKNLQTMVDYISRGGINDYVTWGSNNVSVSHALTCFRHAGRVFVFDAEIGFIRYKQYFAHDDCPYSERSVIGDVPLDVFEPFVNDYEAWNETFHHDPYNRSLLRSIIVEAREHYEKLLQSGRKVI